GPTRPRAHADRPADPTSNPHHLRPRHPHRRTVRVAAGPPSTSTTPAHHGAPPTSRPRPRLRPTAVTAPHPNARGAADAPRCLRGTRSCSVRRRTNSRPRTGPGAPTVVGAFSVFLVGRLRPPERAGTEGPSSG